ncbi:GNAT family N-acetyltransferase [Thalassotalea sp. ND16A]|uniref:GNAT family N-acetyltransferase n=1 Tax=Thalassotalea sp. ND16A TaxID=1535422 RepID=UPI00051A4D9C|nr:GNAT family N-acetyltransferase [Thalassotalea sp. ND16A]KGJ98365.1 hypothetical protein ND16A_0674 [Thalassotalea sp. ND16A]
MVNVREATISDIDIVYDLIIAIAKHHNQEQYVVTNKDELIDSGFADKPTFGVLLAEAEGEVAGYCSYTWNYSIWLGSTYMNIDDVFVWEKFRGKQIGEALMLKAKDVCLAKGASRIRWEVEQDNFGAIKFYQRLGANCDIKGLFRWDVA